MTNFLLLGVCLVLGIILRVTERLPKETPAVLNGFVWYISLPALILVELHQFPINQDIVYPVSAAWLLFVLSASTFSVWGRIFQMERKTVGTLILTAGLGNTSFVGFPMIEALYGKTGLPVAMLVDQLGSFPVLSTLGIVVACIYSGRTVSVRKIVTRVATVPPVYALTFAFALRPFALPHELLELLTKLGGTITPLALVAVGYQLRWNKVVFRAHWKPLVAGLGFKLVLAPALLAWVYLSYFHATGESIQIVLVEVAMAPMITAAVLVSEYDLKSELGSLMIGLGIPLSFLTVPLWAYLLRGV
jgi:predicted permease